MTNNNNSNKLEKITAPYNFVPLNSKIYYPHWGRGFLEDSENNKFAFHDIPFKDAQSGELEITIKTYSPIFVRDAKFENEFCSHNGKFYIPGSTVKGMTRSVLEILSFTKLRNEQFNDSKFALRDLSDAKNIYMTTMAKNVKCGWLKKDKDKYFLQDCGVAGRISHEEIDRFFKLNFVSSFGADFKEENKDSKTAKYKYSLFGENSLKQMLKCEESRNNREIYSFDKNGNKEGILVFTGQPSARKEKAGKEVASGKNLEFIFFKSEKEFEEISEEVVSNFKFAYFDNRDTEPKESPDWAFWKEKLEIGKEIPVFFQRNKGKKEICHFGLSFLYKLPYKHSVKDGIKQESKKDDIDLAQAIFGFIDKGSKKALKGRVYFSHFLATNAVQMQEKSETLGTPRASYYPIYIRQEGDKLKTYMDNFEIAGRKRYPIHKSNMPNKTTNLDNDNVKTKFKPLKEGAIFKGKLRYHNLKPVELGAILSALTFHNTKDAFHNIGLAKSLGYGKIKIEVNMNNENLIKYLREFEIEMSTNIENWQDTRELKELISMAYEQNNTKNSKLEYMELEEFAKYKTNDSRDFLKEYSKLDGIREISIKSLIPQNLNEEIKEKFQENIEWQVVEDSKNITTLESFINKFPNSSRKELILEKIANIKAEAKQIEIEKENQIIEQKWQNLHKDNNKKYLKQSLEKFISDYAEHKLSIKAKEELENLKNPQKIISDNDINLGDFESILSSNKIKELKSSIEIFVKNNLKLNDDEQNTLKNHIIKLYKNAQKNIKKKVVNDCKLDKIFNQKIIDEIVEGIKS